MVTLSIRHSGSSTNGRSDVLGSLGSTRGRVLIRLAPGVVRRLKLIALLVEIVASALDPIGRLAGGFARAVLHEIATFLSPLANCLPNLGPRFGRKENANCSAHAQARQEPQQTVAITIRHKSSSD